MACLKKGIGMSEEISISQYKEPIWSPINCKKDQKGLLSTQMEDEYLFLQGWHI